MASNSMSSPKHENAAKSPAFQANKLESALNSEYQRSHEQAEKDFSHYNELDDARQKALAYPRLLQKHNFFTPHLRRQQKIGIERNVNHERAVLDMRTGLLMSQSTDPLARQHAQNSLQEPELGIILMSNLSPKAKQRFAVAARQGWKPVHTSGNILTLERFVDTKIERRVFTRRATKLFALALFSATAAVWAGDALYRYQHESNTD